MRIHLCLFISVATIASSAIASCASTTPGAQPHDMGAAQHEAMASNEEKAAQQHASQYSPDASVKTQRCGRGGRVTTGLDEGCWTSSTNPTAAHLEDAEKHRKMAADHRAASQALRDAEARACGGISDEDRDESPFAHREDIISVEPLTVGTTSGRSQSARMVGAVVTFRAVPGMTAQWLQRVVDCHLARNSALGHDVPEMPSCPLVPKDVTATVSATNAGFGVAIRAENAETANEVLRRAHALVSH